MDGSEAPRTPNATSETPDIPSTISSLRRAASPTAAISAPQAAPANANPIHGNPVNVVLSAAGRMYHCTHVGRFETKPAVRRSGVTIVDAVASAAYAATSAVVDSVRSHTRPTATIDGPRMFRMSTRNNVTGWAPGLRTNACRRNRKARMKISSPRQQTFSAAAARDRPRRTLDAAASGTASPASQRNSGAANPAAITAYAYAGEPRDAVRVQASSVCASIMRSTAMPRVQSMKAARWLVGGAVLRDTRRWRRWFRSFERRRQAADQEPGHRQNHEQ